MGLLSLLEKLTSDERVDNAVQKHCKHVFGEWEKAWTGQENGLERLRLVNYVPARFSVELTRKEWDDRVRKASQAAPEQRGQKEMDRFEVVEGAREEDVFDELLKLGENRLCVSEGPGAGKTIFSRRLQAYLCTREAQEKHFNGRPALVIRWEESPDRNGVPLPENFVEGFAEELAPYIGKDENAVDVVSQLLRENRVVLILDALDQVTEPSKAALNRFFNRLGVASGGVAPPQCRLVFTSRPYADELARQRRDCTFRMARIERFNVRQQYAYLFGRVAALAPIGGAWLHREVTVSDPALISAAHLRENESIKNVDNALRAAIRNLIPAPDDEDAIVSSPQGLFLVREFCAEQRARKRTEDIRFHSLGDLYQRVCRDSLERAYKNTIQDDRDVDDEILVWLEGMLSAIAMQMLVTDPTRFSFGERPKDNLSLMKSKARSRFPADRPRLPARVFKEDSDWQVVFRVSQLTNRLTGVVSEDKSLSWPNPRMKEFYAARHLVKNQQSNWVDRSKPYALACGDSDLRKNFAHPQWSNVWSLALDLADAGQFDQDRFAAAARHLFDEVQQPRPSKDQSQETWTRPTKPMYRAWALFQETEIETLQTEGQRIISVFQAQFTQILTNGAVSQAKIAARLVPEFALREVVYDKSRFEELKPSKNEEAFMRCPPSGDSGVFWMGTHSKHGNDYDFYDSERPRHPVRLSPFWMQSTSATVEQYLLFDPAFNKSGINAEAFRNYAPSPKCPAIMIRYFDAAMFALWTGNKLPTEAQREFAARASHDGEDELFGISCNGRFKELTSQVANFDGEVPYLNEDLKGKSIDTFVYAQRTLPVRWTLEEHATFQGSEARKPPPFVPNDWGLWQMQGNVFEWCGEVFAVGAYMERVSKLISNVGDATLREIEQALAKLSLASVDVLREPYIYSAGASRGVRGGCWHSDGVTCRAGTRGESLPDVCSFAIGFRLIRCVPTPSRP